MIADRSIVTVNRQTWYFSTVSLKRLIFKYRFVVIFLPLTNLVEVDTDLKLPIPPPPPPLKDEEEKEVTPPPMSPNEVKPTKKRELSIKMKRLIYNESRTCGVICWVQEQNDIGCGIVQTYCKNWINEPRAYGTWIKPWETTESWEAPKSKQRSPHPASIGSPLATATASKEIIKRVISCEVKQEKLGWICRFEDRATLLKCCCFF